MRAASHRWHALRSLRRTLVLCLTAGALVLGPGPDLHGQPALRLVEFPLPTPNARPHSTAVAPDGRIYVAELAANKVAM